MAKINSRKLEDLLPGIKKNVLLKNYTTFKIGGPIKYFFVAKNKEDIIKAVRVVKKNNLPFFIVGGGSNILMADRGFNGIVIKMQNQSTQVNLSARPSSKLLGSGSKYKIHCGAGTLLGRLVSLSAEKNLTGLEWAVGIPGTIGGAIYGNAGAFGRSMANVVKSVEVLEITGSKIQNSKSKIQNYNSKFKIKKYKNKECRFGYRDSIFKKKKDLIIISAELELKRGEKTEIKKKIKEYLNYRRKNQPLEFPSAGSIFKNFTVAHKNLCAWLKELEEFKNMGIIPAAWLIEKAGLKGKKIGKAKISEKHANFIVNLGRAKAKDVKKLINLAKKRVKSKFGINLEEEIQYLNH